MNGKTRRDVLISFGLLGGGSLAGCIQDEETDAPPSDAGDLGNDDGEDAYSVEEVAGEFTHPWGMALLHHGGTALITERPGALYRVDLDSGERTALNGVPDVYTAGQGGLLDVTIEPDDKRNPWVYLTYTIADNDGASATALGRGRFEDDQLAEFSQIFVAEPFIEGSGHFGSRVRFGFDGALYMTTGDRQSKQFDDTHVSQDRGNANGALLRLEAEGSIPSDNPFVGETDVEEAIYSYGIRNAQGLTIHPDTGEIWFSDHGEQDGDALHIASPGGNYGWPVAHYGCTYQSGEAIGELPHERHDIVDPVYHWECNSGGFPPSGMTIYDGDAFPNWSGNLFVGNLAGQYLGRFIIDGETVEETDPILANRGWRIRDVVDHPDTGELFVLIDDQNTSLIKITPT